MIQIQVLRAIKKYTLKKNKNENTICYDLWETAKEVMRGKFMALNLYIRK